MILLLNQVAITTKPINVLAVLRLNLGKPNDGLRHCLHFEHVVEFHHDMCPLEGSFQTCLDVYHSSMCVPLQRVTT